jgi:hypothetical protein
VVGHNNKEEKKMKKYSIVLSFIMLLAVAAPLSAYTWDFASVYGNGGYTSPYAATVITFDTALPASWSLTGNYAIRTGSINDAAAPWWDANGAPPAGARDLTNYLTVPVDVGQLPQSATISFGGSYNNYFGLWWGSMDTYNTFEFLAADLTTAVATVYGTTFSSGNGGQDSSLTNKYVNFYGMPDFYGVRITSTSYAFELDNIGVGYNVVPEPATMLLLGLGLVGLAGIRRKMK